MSGYSFDRFLLYPEQRQLLAGGSPAEINGRYLDALILLVTEQGRLVTKERFMDEVWHGVPVTDEALTQCIRTLRRVLGDEASRPRFIETIPKHGYRFIAAVDTGTEPATPVTPTTNRSRLNTAIDDGLAGTAGGLLAGLVGGLAIGFAATGQGPVGAGSALLVLLCVTLTVALLGGAGVAFGIAGALAWRGRADSWAVVGGAAGGLVVGALVKLLGSDAFMLLVGRAPGDVTGAAEGALLGAALGLALWIGDRQPLRRAVAGGAVLGAVAGGLISLAGGRLLVGSLDQLAAAFPESRLRVSSLGSLFGEPALGPISLVVTASFEGALFGAFLVGAMLARRRRTLQMGSPARMAPGGAVLPVDLKA